MSISVAAIVPVHQYSNRLTEVLHGINAYLPRELILVVNDGSSAETSAQVSQSGVQHISNGRQRGKGFALRAGFDYWRRRNISWALTIDADGQHDPADIPGFLAAAEQTNSDLLIGSRTADFVAMPRDRQFSNRTTSRLLSRLTGLTIEDSQCGYRLVRLAALKDTRWKEDGFAFESEMILRFAQHKREIQFIPIRTIYYTDNPSSMNRYIDTLKFLRMVARTMALP